MDLKKMITDQNEEVIKLQAEHLALTKQLVRKENFATTEEILKFPIKNKEDLDRVEKEMEVEEMREKYFNIVKQLWHPGGIRKNFNKIFGEEISLQFNHDGVKNKHALKDYKNITDAVYSKFMKIYFIIKNFII